MWQTYWQAEATEDENEIWQAILIICCHSYLLMHADIQPIELYFKNQRYGV
ncbi:MAG: hypothetical protein ABFC18_03190 [Rikenellaceae bacterium]